MRVVIAWLDGIGEDSNGDTAVSCVSSFWSNVETREACDSRQGGLLFFRSARFLFVWLSCALVVVSLDRCQ